MSGFRQFAEISDQLMQAHEVIERHCAPTLLAMYVFGSVLDGGLKSHSDIDVLAVLDAPPDEAVRRALLLDLLKVSAPPGQSRELRALDVTMIVHRDVVPWRYPARRALQFGEWLRKDILSGVFEPAVFDPDLAILLMKARQHSIALTGPLAEEFFDPVPEDDFYSALCDALKRWNSPSDWAGDERNVVLTLARIWYSAATGKIAPKDVAARWVKARLPIKHRPVLQAAFRAYLGEKENRLVYCANQMMGFVCFVKEQVIGEQTGRG